MSGELVLTPWSRTGLVASGLTRDTLRARVPDGHVLHVSAAGSRGPFTLSLRHMGLTTRTVRETAAYRWSDLPAAIDRVLGEAVAA